MTMYFVNFKLAKCRTIARAAFSNGKEIWKIKGMQSAARNYEFDAFVCCAGRKVPGNRQLNCKLWVIPAARWRRIKHHRIKSAQQTLLIILFSRLCFVRVHLQLKFSVDGRHLPFVLKLVLNSFSRSAIITFNVQQVEVNCNCHFKSSV